MEGTCREASRTYHGNSCGHFPGGEKMVGAHGRRDEDFPGEVGLGFKGSRGGGGGYIVTQSGQDPGERMRGKKRGKHRNPC